MGVSINFKPSTLDYQKTKDYRQELILAIYNPGTDWSPLDPDAEEVEKAYRHQLGLADKHLASFGLGDPDTGAEASLKDLYLGCRSKIVEVRTWSRGGSRT